MTGGLAIKPIPIIIGVTTQKTIMDIMTVASGTPLKKITLITIKSESLERQSKIPAVLLVLRVPMPPQI